MFGIWPVVAERQTKCRTAWITGYVMLNRLWFENRTNRSTRETIRTPRLSVGWSRHRPRSWSARLPVWSVTDDGAPWRVLRVSRNNASSAAAPDRRTANGRIPPASCGSASRTWSTIFAGTAFGSLDSAWRRSPAADRRGHMILLTRN